LPPDLRGVETTDTWSTLVDSAEVVLGVASPVLPQLQLLRLKLLLPRLELELLPSLDWQPLPQCLLRGRVE